MIAVKDAPALLLDELALYEPPAAEKWVNLKA
jgi:hypothetical protein